MNIGRFELPRHERRALLARQTSWAVTQMLAATAFSFWGMGSGNGIATAVAVGLGLAVARREDIHLVPFHVLATVAGALILGVFGFDPLMAAGAAAGLLAGRPGFTGRIEGFLAGMAATGIADWAFLGLTEGSLGFFGFPLFSLLTGFAAAQALLPGALAFQSQARVPSPGNIQSTLQVDYRPPCLRAWQLEQELLRQAPDLQTREGLGEVGFWVYRLGLTLQTLDQDIARVDPEAVATRRQELLTSAAATDDSFIRDRQQGTAQHLERLLQHRTSLVRERARTVSLQDYALAYMEEARAGLAVARLLPGDETPEQLGAVLTRLREHAAEGGARRQAAREMQALRS